jgi:hypothetical protein
MPASRRRCSAKLAIGSLSNTVRRTCFSRPPSWNGITPTRAHVVEKVADVVLGYFDGGAGIPVIDTLPPGRQPSAFSLWLSAIGLTADC